MIGKKVLSCESGDVERVRRGVRTKAGAGLRRRLEKWRYVVERKCFAIGRLEALAARAHRWG